VRIRSGASTDKGQVREGNEDSYLVDRQLELFAVADGMGGHRAGEVASATALEGLRTAVAAGTAVSDAVASANAAVWDMAAGDTDLAGMGTTLTAATFDGVTLTIGHVGDSRAYLLRDGRLDRLTTDHSLVEELIRDGKITEAQAAVHPQRSIITRALGVDSQVEVDVYSVLLQPGDRVMLCSDGLTSMVRGPRIAEILVRETDPTVAANALVDTANAAGGEDNITVVVLDAESDGRDPLPSSVAAAIRGEGATAAETATPVAEGDGPPTEVVADPVEVAATTTTTLDAADPTSAPPALPKDTARYREPRSRRRIGRPIWRALAFALPILLIIGAAIATIGWYAQNSYFVAATDGKVVVYQGRPGGLLFWDPSVVERTGIDVADLTDDFRQGVRERKEFSSKTAALAYVGRARSGVTTTTTSTSTTSTTVPPTTTAP
jgi:serine/threonine protein phosphatase PrpC